MHVIAFFSVWKRGSNHLLIVATTVAIALLPAGSLAVLGKEALPHVNDPPVHVVARVRLLGRVNDVSFVEFLHPGRVPGTLFPCCTNPSCLCSRG